MLLAKKSARNAMQTKPMRSPWQHWNTLRQNVSLLPRRDSVVIILLVLAEFPGDFALAGLSEGEGFKGAFRMETEMGGGWARHHLLAGGWANRFAPDLAPLRCAGPVFDHCAAGRAESTSKA
jgi:hypothetical protein